MFDIHHLIVDGTSLDFILEDLALLLRFHPLPPMGESYDRFVQWQATDYTTHRRQEDGRFWREALDPVCQCSPALPPASATTDFEIGFKRQSFDAETIRSVARLLATTPFAVVLAAFHFVLIGRSGNWTQIVGVPVACRDDARFARTVGMFVNTVCAIGVYRPTMTVREAITATFTRWRNVSMHQHYPIAEVLGRETEKHPAVAQFHAMLAYQNLSFLRRDVLGGSARIGVEAKRHTEFGLTLHAFEGTSELDLHFEYQRRWYSAQEITELAGNFSNILQAMPASLEQTVGELVLGTPARRALIRRELVDFRF
jgi:non-ribosomal peptide synthetase component F